MTVKEYIAELSKFPMDTIVVLHTEELTNFGCSSVSYYEEADGPEPSHCVKDGSYQWIPAGEGGMDCIILR